MPIIRNFKKYEEFLELSKEMVDELIESIYIYESKKIKLYATILMSICGLFSVLGNNGLMYENK